ncbi:beta-N-acetylhexosaminidase [Paracidovorax anthurii]|uniref:Beta-hexosaminidase n=1 Tax=Paracidovorax anthurii TaxID=78229 RepID=A0A328Z7G1_9BURK|nr:beta-N-acetylhexosaminidase [Paracidovorax anthurii]RAR81789.1 beta-N-acetylhexosaminidase [Paracidovorax anthurii]
MTPDIEHAPVILDVAGTALSDADRRRLAHPLTGGVILFARNWRDRAQLLELTASIKAVRDDLLICVDHEGGRVQRFRTDGFTPLPPMRALGAMWMADGRQRPGSGALRATQAATAVGYVLASELRACGVDFSFAPVLDLDWPGDAAGAGSAGGSQSSVIGDRAFHGDPRVVTLLAKSVAHGMLQAGMAHCGKHFPGHGFVRADSHTDVPVDRRSLKAILADDAAPYEWLCGTLTAVMPAHVIYPKVDGRPAGFSQRWLQDILRQRLRFGGAIFSDDLSMEGARRIDGAVVDYATAALAALEAGCDLVVLCNQSLVGEGAERGRALDDLLDGLSRARALGRWRPSPGSESRRVALLPQTLPLPWDELMLEPAYMQALDSLP